MKFQITFKDPDGVHDSITEVISDQLSHFQYLNNKLPNQDEVEQNWREQINESISKWVDYGEYITVEFDTDAGTATVVEA